MDINWANLLDEIQDLRGVLEQWGVTYQFLMALGVAAFALFLISLREIVIWYLRISQLHAQMYKMSQQLSQLQSSVDQVHVKTVQVQEQTAAPPVQAKVPVFQESPAEAVEDDEPQSAAARKKKFNLDH